MTRTAEYIRQAKAALGNASMSDREMGQLLGGIPSQVISKARYGNMSDPLAIKVARVIGCDAGELINVARVEREQDPEVKAELEMWIAKTLAAVPSTVTHKRDGMAAMVDQLTARPRRRAAAVVLTAGLIAAGAPSPADAAGVTGLAGAVHYVKPKISQLLPRMSVTPQATRPSGWTT